MQWGCACPLGTDGAFCKHLVAAGLAAIQGRNAHTPQTPPDLEAIAADLRAVLAPCDRTRLLEMLVQRAVWDESLLDEIHLLTRFIKNYQ